MLSANSWPFFLQDFDWCWQSVRHMFKYAVVCCNQPILELKLSYAQFSSSNPKLRNKIFEIEFSIPDIMKFFLKMIKQIMNSVWLRLDYSALGFRLRSQIAKSSSAQIKRSLWNSDTLQSPHSALDKGQIRPIFLSQN